MPSYATPGVCIFFKAAEFFLALEIPSDIFFCDVSCTQVMDQAEDEYAEQNPEEMEEEEEEEGEVCNCSSV